MNTEREVPATQTQVEAYEAEIERLKSELNQSRKLAQLWIDKSARQSQLITELCDALKKYADGRREPPSSPMWTLIQRAREAAR